MLTRKRTGFFDSAASAAFSLAVSGPISSSTMNTPSSPTETATLPPAKPFSPSIIDTPPATGVVFSVTLAGSPPICAPAGAAASSAAAVTPEIARRLARFVIAWEFAQKYRCVNRSRPLANAV